jgi:hypothetical protein
MAPRDALRRRSAVKRADPSLVAYGLAAILAGIAVGYWVEAPALRLLGSLTLIVIGFGLVRQAFRLE